MKGRAIPVTLISGFLGAGKTTLLRNILQENQSSSRVAVIVNDMAELNIDAKLVRSVIKVEEKLVEMQNGCICCSLREDLLVELKKLAEENRFDYIIIESTGISEPQQVAETFAFEDANGVALNDWTKLDTTVTVVDCLNFLEYLKSEKTVQDSKENTGPDDERSISYLLVDQIEFADVILLNKCDLVDSKLVVEKIAGIVSSLNHDARVIRTTHSKVEIENVMNTHLFDLDNAVLNPGWMKVMRGAPLKPETLEYGIGSFIYRRRKAFHPKRLYDLLQQSEPLPGVIRSKGFCWLEGHNDMQGVWASTGKMFSIESDGNWFAAMKEEEWDPNLDKDAIKADFQEPFGDRRQEIVFIGVHLIEKDIIEILDKALMSDGEKLNEDSEDPWSYLDEEEDDHHCDHEE